MFIELSLKKVACTVNVIQITAFWPYLETNGTKLIFSNDAEMIFDTSYLEVKQKIKEAMDQM